MVEEYNILVTSVGGQGGVTLARVLSYAAMGEGLNVRVGETLGMAQRGGPVQSHVRVGDRVHGSQMPRGRCDVLLSLEPAESVRAPEFLGLGTRVVMSTAPVYPIPVMLKEETYPELGMITAALGRIGCRVHALDARELAIGAEAPASLNVVVLGAYAALEEGVIGTESIRRALGEALPRRFLEQNTKAFDLGYAKMRHLL
ncbi:indolepyruvate oxidoreductase subunit beta [Candidatus Bathyarchaeota archaeon]|nr:indolepyruvate oxidoreductase subunit beta [Candidatus Bathyarchaeota archaeon]